MFLDIGNGRVVFQRDIIGIFHMNLKNNPVNKEFLESANTNLYHENSRGRVKSFVVTDSDVLFSPIVPTTLARKKRSLKESNQV